MNVQATDGEVVACWDEGEGPSIVILHSGLDDGRGYARVARRLSRQFRVIRVRRRSYLPDFTGVVSVAAELGDVSAVADAVGGPMVLVGHSSGGNLALEVLAALPGRFAGAVLYEPVFVRDLPLLRPDVYRTQCEAFTAGRTRQALVVHLHEHVGFSPLWSWLLARVAAAVPSYRGLIRGMVVLDAAAIDAAGDRRADYRAIAAPVLLVGGSCSPAVLKDSLDELESLLGASARVTMRGQGHCANLFRPGKLAAIIEQFADRCVRLDSSQTADS